MPRYLTLLLIPFVFSFSLTAQTNDYSSILPRDFCVSLEPLMAAIDNYVGDVEKEKDKAGYNVAVKLGEAQGTYNESIRPFVSFVLWSKKDGLISEANTAAIQFVQAFNSCKGKGLSLYQNGEEVLKTFNPNSILINEKVSFNWIDPSEELELLQRNRKYRIATRIVQGNYNSQHAVVVFSVHEAEDVFTPSMVLPDRKNIPASALCDGVKGVFTEAGSGMRNMRTKEITFTNQWGNVSSSKSFNVVGIDLSGNYGTLDTNITETEIQLTYRLWHEEDWTIQDVGMKAIEYAKIMRDCIGTSSTMTLLVAGEKAKDLSGLKQGDSFEIRYTEPDENPSAPKSNYLMFRAFKHYSEGVILQFQMVEPIK